MSLDNNFTVKEQGESILKVKGSKFIGIVFSVSTHQEWDMILSHTQKIHSKASHHCYAYRINDDEKSSDDGEPRGTAGAPILNQLQKNNLLQIGAIVVRHFGGTLLGKGGLIRAYRQCVAEAIENAEIIEIQLMTRAVIMFDYSVYADLIQEIKRLQWTIVSQDLIQNPRIKVSANRQTFDSAVSRLREKLMATKLINYDVEIYDKLIQIRKE